MTQFGSPAADEAAKLFEALAGWARTSFGEQSFATGSPECQVCPVCQLVAALRQARPETFTHLLEASTALTAALKSLVEAHEHAASSRSTVERIRLDDEPAAAESW